MDDSSKGGAAPGLGKMEQLSSNVCRLESGTNVTSHSYGRVPGEGVDVERGSRENKSLDAFSDRQTVVNASVSRHSLHDSGTVEVMAFTLWNFYLLGCSFTCLHTRVSRSSQVPSITDAVVAEIRERPTSSRMKLQTSQPKFNYSQDSCVSQVRIADE